MITLRRYTKKVPTAEKGGDLSIAGDGGSLPSRKGSAYSGFCLLGWGEICLLRGKGGVPTRRVVCLLGSLPTRVRGLPTGVGGGLTTRGGGSVY